MKTEVLAPVRVIVLDGCAADTDTLLHAKSAQIALDEPEVCTVSGAASLLLDFGREVCGTLRILTHLCEGICPIRIRLGESYGEANAQLGEKGACNDHSLRDMHTGLTAYSDMCFCQSAFRFCRLDLEAVGTVRLKNIYAVDCFYEAPLRYEYTGSDARIRAVFETARRTIDRCVQNDMVWDGAKRDRLVWAGDLHPELLALTTLYGRCRPLENALLFLRDITPADSAMNAMPTYSVWWLICMADYYFAVGDRTFITESRVVLEQKAAQLAQAVEASGEVSCGDWFIDWPNHGGVDEYEGCRALYLFGAKRFRALCAAFDWDTAAMDTVITRLQKKPITVQSSKAVTALKWFATGALTPEDTARLTAGGATGFSTFLSYYILKAIAETSGADTALTMMKEYYGAMLDRGATTFFEDFQMEWLENSGRVDAPTPVGKRDIHGDFGAFCYVGFRHSLCHGWSTGVLRFIEEYAR